MNIETYIKERALKAKRASDEVAHLSSEVKNACLRALAEDLLKRENEILEENAKDLAAGRKNGLSAAMLDRLTLNPSRIADMANAVLEIIELPDPVGQVVKAWERPNGLKISRVRIPLGVIGMIYESRPNVTIDAAVLCFKAGNAVVLRGGSEAIHSNLVLSRILKETSARAGISPEWVEMIEMVDRETIPVLVKQVGLVDLIIPRGGEGLMKFIDEHARIPVLKHDKGVCSLYIDRTADLSKAIEIAINSKVQRPGVCNALENLFVHEAWAAGHLPELLKALSDRGVEIRGDERVRGLFPAAKPVCDADWGTEYLELILSVGVVKDLDHAILRIRESSSLHTEAIVTEDEKAAEKFLRELNSSCVLWNASTRFNDGGQLGLGAEIGISTTKLHAFGPMGLEELTTTKFVVRGDGQVRK